MGDKNDTEDMQGEEKKTWLGRVKESYQQQTSSVWTPEYTVHTMWGPFLVMGCVMLVLGGGLLYVQGGYNEVEWDYTDCICRGTGMNATDYLQTSKPSGPCKCIKELNITEENNQAKWDRDILLYYELENFHQNHRQYADSRDDKQLNGDRLRSDGFPDLPFSDCEDPHNNVYDNLTEKTLPIVPCGSIANSLFNDTVRLFFRDSFGRYRPVSLLNTGIAMPFDKKRFNNPVNDMELKKMLENKIAKPRDWTKQLWELDPTNPSNNGLENEDLIVWMRVSALANFRKLWRRVDHDDQEHTELKDGLNTAYPYFLEIEYNYDVSGFNGRKKVIIARDNEFGAKNTAMGWIAISAAIFFFSFGFLFSALTRLDQ
eukprot:GFUD01023322.1.p1 GENE.GFUD01023322.1~~GFUD01023322.1.p1  ORF type:complete len:372 (+),score=104.06 GFUD01023322.1:91-1206(+)